MSAVADDWLVTADLAPAYEGTTLAPLFDAAAGGVLAMPFCAACGLALDLEQHVCDRCEGTEIRWEKVEPVGSVHALTVVHRTRSPLLRTHAPYPVLDVELASGHRLIMTTAHPPAGPIAIGDRVAITFRHVGSVAVPAAVPVPPEENAL